MNLKKGQIVFCEEPKKVGIVTNEEENLVRLDGDTDTTPVDPEYCHPATAEECNGTEFNLENTDQPAKMDASANTNTENELVEETASTDLNEDIDH